MKKFYDRVDELSLLAKADKLKDKRSIMSVIIGRRRVGKTALILQDFSNSKKLYFFVSKKSERLLVEEFTQEVKEKLNIKIFGEIKSFEKLFEYLLELSKEMPFTLVIDEFQDFYKVNESIFSSMQKLWDLNKDSSHMHLILSGSVYSLMKKIFQNAKEPLFARADFKIDLKPFNPMVLKEILQDYNAYNATNLLDFYTISGGVAKYIELFVLYESFSQDSMIDEIFQENSLFLDEGKNRLIEEFGKEYSVYFSILSLIASSKTSKSEIESVLEKNISGYLERLHKDYNIIKPIKPIGAKVNSKLQKYEIVDNFLSFWFRFIYKYQSYIESKNFALLKQIVRRDFSTYKGRFLEKLFIEIFKDSKEFTQVDSYWERGNKNEIDIVALNELTKKMIICEVKLNKEKLNLNELIFKSKKLVDKFKDYEVEYELLSLDDIDRYMQMGYVD